MSLQSGPMFSVHLQSSPSGGSQVQGVFSQGRSKEATSECLLRGRSRNLRASGFWKDFVVVVFLFLFFPFFFFFLFFLLGRLQGLMLVTLLHPHLEERKTVDKVPLEKSLQRLWQQK